MDYVEEERNIKARSQALAAFKEQILNFISCWKKSALNGIYVCTVFLKVWWQDATLFVYFSYFYNIHAFISITFIHYIYPSSFAEASLHFFIACVLSGKHLSHVQYSPKHERIH